MKLKMLSLFFMIVIVGNSYSDNKTIVSKDKEIIELRRENDQLHIGVITSRKIIEDLEKRIKKLENEKLIEKQVFKNDELGMVYNIDQIYSNSLKFYDDTLALIFALVGGLLTLATIAKYKENERIEKVRKNLENKTIELHRKIEEINKDSLDKIESVKKESLKEINEKSKALENSFSDKMKEESKMTEKGVLINEFSRDLFELSKEKDENMKKNLIERIDLNLKDKYKILDNELKIEFIGRQINFYYEINEKLKIEKILENMFKTFGYVEQSYKIRAEYRVLEKNFKEAKEDYLEIIEIVEGKSKELYLNILAKMESEIGDVDEALRYYKDLSLKNPQDSYYLSTIGDLKRDKGFDKEAEEYYNKAIEYSPENSYYLSLLGNLKKEQGFDKEAEEYYNKAKECSPKNSYYLSVLGNLKKEQGFDKEAEEYYNKAIEYSPENSYYLSLLGNLKKEQGFDKEAEGYYEQAVRNSPKDSYSLSLLGGIKEKQGFDKEAERYYEQAVRNSPKDSYILSLLGGIKEKQGFDKEAEGYYEQAVRNSPKDSYYLSLLGGIKEKLGFDKEAEGYYEQAINNSKKNDGYYIGLLGEIKEKLGFSDEAKKYYEEGVKKSPKSDYNLELLMKIEEKNKNYFNSAKICKKLLKLNPIKINYYDDILRLLDKLNKEERDKIFLFNEDQTVNNLIRFMSKGLKEKINEEEIEKEIKKLEVEDEFFRYLGLYFINKNDLIAKKILEIYTEKNGNYWETFNMLGVLEERFDNEAQALKYYNKAIEINKNSVVYFNRGHLKFNVKNYVSALKDLELSKELNKQTQKLNDIQYEKVLLLLGVVYIENKQYLEAVLLSEELYEVNRDRTDQNISNELVNIYKNIFKDNFEDEKKKIDEGNLKYLNEIIMNLEKIKKILQI